MIKAKADGARGCRRGKVFYQDPTTNQTMLWNLFWSNSTVAVIVRLLPCKACFDTDCSERKTRLGKQ